MLFSPQEASQRAVRASSQRPQISRLGRGQHQRSKRAGPKHAHLLGIQTPVDQLATMRQTTTRTSQPLLADRHLLTSEALCYSIARRKTDVQKHLADPPRSHRRPRLRAQLGDRPSGRLEAAGGWHRYQDRQIGTLFRALSHQAS